MRQVEVVYRPEAVDDLQEIFRYVLQRSKSRAVAGGYISRLRDCCRGIGLAPSAGTPRDDLMPGLRTVAFERRAVIAYLIEGDTAVVTNIFFGGRDFEAIYRGRDPESG